MQVVYPLLDVFLLLLLIGGNIERAQSEEPQSWSISSFKPYEDSDLLIAANGSIVVENSSYSSHRPIIGKSQANRRRKPRKEI